MNKPRKKIPAVVLDVDDTIVAFLTFLCDLYNRKNSTTISVEDLTTWNFYDTVVEDAQGNVVKGRSLRKFFRDYEKNGLYAAVPPIRDSVWALEIIKKLGYKIILLTARNEQFKRDTEINFLANKIIYDDIIFKSEDDKDNYKGKHINRLARKHRIVVFVDDNYKHVKDVLDTDKVDICYLLNKPHNQGSEIGEDEGIIRVSNLLEVARTLPDVTGD